MLRRISTVAGSLLLVAWALISLVAMLPGLRAEARTGQVDFFTFLDSAREWHDGRDPYATTRTVPGPDGQPVPAHPNLNHPATIPAFAPLVALSPAGAYYAWAVLAVVAWALSVAWSMHIAGARARIGTWFIVAALAVTFPGAVYGVQLGQVGLPLVPLVVACWAGLRHAPGTRAALAGALGLGVLVALKPFFFPVLLIFVPRRDWRGLLAAAAGGIGLSLVALPLMGLNAFSTWIKLGGAVDWYDHGFNLGLTGIIWRITPTLPVATTWAVAVGTALVAALTLRATPPAGLSRVDRDLGLLLVAAILGSPLGWLYYTPLLLPALAALFAARESLAPASRRLALGACALLWVPHALLPVLPEALWSQLTLRAAASWGLVALWMALGWATAPPQTGPSGVGYVATGAGQPRPSSPTIA